jgi:CheY-like chemotaxis protein
MRILFIDDEDLLREYMYEMLSDMGHSVVVEADGQKAVDLFLSDPEAFDLVLTDQIMFGIMGDEVSERIHAIRADTPVAVMTGTPGTISPEKAEAAFIRKVLPKPLTKAELAEALREFSRPA